MSTPETQPAAPEPERPWFQFTLRTLLLLFVVLGSSLAVFGGWGIGVFGLVVGLATYLHHAESYRPLGCLLVVLCPVIGFGLLVSAVEVVRTSGRRMHHLEQIAAALLRYEQANGCFPPAYIADKYGKPMYSWRVLILPYLDQDALYKLYDSTQPWDGPKNKMVSATPNEVYLYPADPNGPASRFPQTSYVAVVGSNAALRGGKPRKAIDFGKDASRTIMLVEVTKSGIAWAEPRDFSLDTLGTAGGTSSTLALKSDDGGREDFFFTYDCGSGMNVAMADGSVRYVWLGNRSPDDLRKLLQIGGFTDKESEETGRRLNWPNIAALAVWLLSVGTLLTYAVRSRNPVVSATLAAR